MTIKRKVQFGAVALLAGIGLISGLFVMRSILVQKSEKRLSRVASVVRSSGVLYALSQEYIARPSLETKGKWNDVDQSIAQTLDNADFDAYQDNATFLELRRHMNTIEALFSQITSTQKDEQLRERLGREVLLHTNNFFQDSAKLEDAIFAETEIIRQRTTVGFFVSLELLFALVVGLLVLVTKEITDPVTKLTQAVWRIASGDFSFRAPATSTDEIGTLGAAFNSMTERLQSRTIDLEKAKARDEELLKDLNSRIVQLEDARKAMANLFEDIEEERRLLTKVKARDEALLEDIGDGVIAVDKNKSIILINRIAEHLLGISREEVLGRQYYEVFGNQDAEGKFIDEPRRPISKVLAAGKRYTTQVGASPSYYYTRNDGTKFPVSITVTPVILNGETVGAIDIFRDVTREKEIEKLRIDFLVLASHQLRTPLSGTKWLIETIRRGITGEVSKKQQEYLDQIYQTNERMIALVYDMLDVLKIESGETLVKKVKLTAQDLFNDLEVVVAPILKKKNIIMHSILEKDTLIKLETDPEILRSILEEFISNAVEYSESGMEVVFGAREDGNSVIFSVKDTGIGIPKDEQGKILERFYRASNAKEFRPEGTGLGLYRATLLAEKLGAQITIESEVGKGATFYLDVPKQAE